MSITLDYRVVVIIWLGAMVRPPSLLPPTKLFGNYYNDNISMMIQSKLS